MLKNILRYSMIVLALGFAACEDSPTGPPANLVPTASAGPDQAITDIDGGGDEGVTLDGSASSDSDGMIASWVWTENAIEIGTGESPVVVFAVGSHTVTLTVTDDEGDTDTDDVVITVNPKPANVLPTANAGPDQMVADIDGGGDENVTLDGSGSTDADGTIVSYVWTENTVEITTGATPTVVFAVGAHTVTLTVTDDEGATSTDDVVITVGPNQAPIANAGPDQAVADNDGSGDQSVMLDGSSSIDSDGAVVSWVWTESSAQIATGASPAVVFTVGAHTVTLTVTDDGGLTSTDDVLITVGPNAAPISNAGPDQGVTDNDGNGTEMISLDGSGSTDSDGTIVSYVWTESAAQIATGETPAAMAFTVGVHTVTLTVTDDGGLTSTDDVIITVGAQPANVDPTANAGPDQTVTDTDGGGTESVTLDGSASTDTDGTIASWVWTENAAQIGTGVSPTLTFTVGVHTVTLTVTDDRSDSDTNDVIITVGAQPANVDPTANAGPDQGVTD
ncbi:MAG: PKD domain-containing protein, partial [Gemmatimonadota bacterium]